MQLSLIPCSSWGILVCLCVCVFVFVFVFVLLCFCFCFCFCLCLCLCVCVCVSVCVCKTEKRHGHLLKGILTNPVCKRSPVILPGARAFGVILFRRQGSVCEYLFVGPAYGLSTVMQLSLIPYSSWYTCVPMCMCVCVCKTEKRHGHLLKGVSALSNSGGLLARQGFLTNPVRKRSPVRSPCFWGHPVSATGLSL